MKNFDLSFSNPLILLLAIPLVFLTVFPFLRLAKRRRTKKHLISLICRCLALMLLVAMLSGVTYIDKSDDVSVMVLVDLSDSTLPMRYSMDSFTKELLTNADSKTKIGLMAFADNCVYELKLDNNDNFTSLSDLKSEPIGDATNIEDALRTAASSLETNTCGRVILLSDGKQTKGDAQSAATELAYQQIRVDSVFFNTENPGSAEVQINDVDIPETTYMGNAFTISVTVNSTVEANGTLTIYDDDLPVVTQDVTVQQGINTYTLQSTASSSGIHTFRTVLETDSDSITQNNSYYSYIKVSGSPSILLIDGTGNESAKITAAFGDKYEITKTTAANAPSTLAQLQKYDEVILMNVSADDLPQGFDGILETYVKTLGRSVFTTGGKNTYYYGSMTDTKFEDMLPVNIDAEDDDESGSTALIILIDSSMSMQGARTTLARQGAIKCINALADTDYAGIISFSGFTNVMSELTSLKNRDEIIYSIDAIFNSSGTYLYDAVIEAYGQLSDSDADNKHMIILSDGNPNDSGYANVIQSMKTDGITTSTILCGNESSDLMESLARLGGGQFYEARDVNDLPDIMLNVAESIITSYINEDVFIPQIGQISAVLSGVKEIPELGGYITTTIKKGAVNVLYTEENRPVYAEWKYGLGNVASFTSDLSGDWSNTFLSDAQGIKFIQNIISNMLPNENTTTGLTIDITQNGAQANVQAKTSDKSGNSTVEAIIVPPKGDSYTILLNAISPGVYESTMETADEGIYTMFVQQSDTDGNLMAYREAAVAASYSAEYDAFLEGGDTLLTSISNLAGGELMNSSEDLFNIEMLPTETEKNPYIPLGLLATLLLLADLVMRNTKWKDVMNFFHLNQKQES